MSVILRRNNKIILYCKGADNVIYDRLGSNQHDVKHRTQEHLNVRKCGNQYSIKRKPQYFIRNSLAKDFERSSWPNG